MGLLDLSPYRVTNLVSLIDATTQDSAYDAIQAVVNALVDANVDPAAALAVAKLAAGVNGQILQTVSGVPTWVPGTKTTTSAMSGGPPGSPADGDIWIAAGVDGNGVRWTFQYNAASASAFKWECIGGPPVYAKVDTEETVNNAAYAALATPGPSITVARQGDYYVEVGAYCIPGPTSLHIAYMSYDVGATGALDADAFRTRLLDSTANRGAQNSGSALRLKAGVAAGAAITAKYKSTAGDVDTYGNRWMRITPLRII